MKILVLGSNGFIGRHLVEQLSAKGYDVLSPKRQVLDLLNQDATEAYLREHRPDVLINCAITITSAETNLNIYYNLERCSTYFGRLLNVGSGAEYAVHNRIPDLPESHFGLNIPTDTYGISKFCIAKDIERSRHDVINLRVFGIFGEGEDHTRRFITNNICSSIRNNTITVNRNSVFDYIDVLDFVRIVEKCLTLKAQFRSYNACTSIPHSLLELASIIDQVSGRKNTLTVVNKEIASVYTGSNRRLLDEIGHFTFTPMEASVKRLFAWYETEFSAGRIE